MRGVGAGSNNRQTKNRYITITSVSPDTLLDHKRHTQEPKNYTLHTHLPSKPVFWGVGVGSSFRRVEGRTHHREM